MMVYGSPDFFKIEWGFNEKRIKFNFSIDDFYKQFPSTISMKAYKPQKQYTGSLGEKRDPIQEI